MHDTATGKIPPLVSLLMVIVGALISVLGGFGVSAIIGGAIAAAGCMPASYGIWTGMQQKTQATLAFSLLMLILSLVIGVLLIVLSVLGWM